MRATIQQVLWSWKIAVVVALLAAISAYADTPPTWAALGSFAGGGNDAGYAVKVDKSGNRYVTGFFSSTATFDGQTLVSKGDTDIFLAKIAPDESLLWLVQIGGAGQDEGMDIGFDFQGNVYLTGWFSDSAIFGSVNGATKTRTGTGRTVFLAKYSAGGNVVWVFKGTAGGGLIDSVGLAINPTAGSIYLTGLNQGTLNLTSADLKTYEVAGPSTWHMFLVKYDLEGQFQWGEFNEAAPNSIPHNVAVDSSDNAYVTGWFEGSAAFTSADGHNQTIIGLSGPVQSAPDYPDDTFVVKYDANGNVKWINDIGGYKAVGTDIAVSPTGAISITGFIGNINTGNSTQAVTIVTSQSPGSNINLGGGDYTSPYNPDVVIASYDGNGVLLSASRIGGANLDAGNGIVYDSLGNLYACGDFQGTITVGGQTLNGTQTNNLYVLKYTGGSLAWAVVADGAGTQTLNIEYNAKLGTRPGSSKVFVTGAYAGTATFGNITLHSAGGLDIFATELQ